MKKSSANLLFCLNHDFSPPIGERRKTGHLLEQMRELGGCAKSARLADVGRRHVRTQEHLLGLLDTIVAQIFAGRHVRLHLEEGEEPGTRVADVIDQSVQIDARRVVAFYPFDGFAEYVAVGTAAFA